MVAYADGIKSADFSPEILAGTFVGNVNKSGINSAAFSSEIPACTFVGNDGNLVTADVGANASVGRNKRPRTVNRRNMDVDDIELGRVLFEEDIAQLQ